MTQAGCFTIAADHPSLPGHFPGRPVVPGVVLLDHAAALVAAATGRAVLGYAAVRFLHPVLPDEQVEVLAADAGFEGRVAGRAVFRATPVFGPSRAAP